MFILQSKHTEGNIHYPFSKSSPKYWTPIINLTERQLAFLERSEVTAYLFLLWQIPFKNNRKVKHFIKIYNHYFISTILKFPFISVIKISLVWQTLIKPFCLNCKHQKKPHLFQFIKTQTSKAIAIHMTSQFNMSSALLTVIIQSFETAN